MTKKAIGLVMKGSVAIVAALILTACGGGDSGGSNSVSVPNVVGDTQAAASAAITGAGLKVGAVTTQSSSTVASGDVISETPAAATTATKGSAVALVVSSGAVPVSVPNVVGDTQAAASAAITGAGLTVGTVATQTSGTVASGNVISENPAAATSVAKGSAVALVVSSGSPTHTVGGTLIGLGASATLQVLNGTDTLSLSANGAFTLPTGLPSGGTYAVTVGTPTTTRAQTCTVQNGTGTVTSANVTNIVVYCTYNVTKATLNATYTTAIVNFNDTGGGPAEILDGSVVATYNGSGDYNGTATFNSSGRILTNFAISDVYTVTTTDAIPDLTTNSGTSGGIEGANAHAVLGSNALTGIAPGITVGVLPNASATTASIDGNYTLVDMTASLSTGAMSGYDATINVTNGTVTGTYIENDGGTVTGGFQASGQWSVTNGAITAAAYGSGAVSADGDLIVLADTTAHDNPSIEVAVRRGTGVTKATFEGVYNVSESGGTTVTAMIGKAITLFAHGDGTYSVTFTENVNGTITKNNTDTGTYTIATDGTLTLTDSEGDVYNGALAADGNALVLASITSTQNPAISVGVRQ
jgi:hypothetical protein